MNKKFDWSFGAVVLLFVLVGAVSLYSSSPRTEANSMSRVYGNWQPGRSTRLIRRWKTNLSHKGPLIIHLLVILTRKNCLMLTLKLKAKERSYISYLSLIT